LHSVLIVMIHYINRFRRKGVSGNF
jgi:hypothetical protein